MFSIIAKTLFFVIALNLFGVAKKFSMIKFISSVFIKHT